MSESIPTLQHKIDSAKDLHSVVRTMKAMAASNISQYEQAVVALEDYYRTVRLGVTALAPIGFYTSPSKEAAADLALSNSIEEKNPAKNGIIIFGSDQGLVGQFNESLFGFMRQTLKGFTTPALFWPVGERMQSRINEHNYNNVNSYALPRNLHLITTLVTELLLEIDQQRQRGNVNDIYIFFNRPLSKLRYAPTLQKLLPLDDQWRLKLAFKEWPCKSFPQLINSPQKSVISVLHEYLFVSLFKSCVASLASENASRLVAMQRAEKNIEELQEQLYRNYHQQRQQSVDEELFDLVAGFEALKAAN
jgi:F-type H+-transporting ATPase subunit gamma